MLKDRFGDLTGKVCFEEYMKRKTPCELCLVKKALKTGETQKFELSAPDGKIYELTSTPFKDIDGKIRVIEIVRDITNLKKTDRQIKESEERFRELFDHMSSGVAVYEAIDDGNDFIIKDFNRAAEKIENVKRKIIVGRSVLDVFPGVKEFGIFDVFKRVWKTGKPESHPVSLYEDNRIAGWRENYVYKLPSGEIVSIYDDITKRKQDEEKIEESEKRFRKSIMDAPLPIMIHKENGKVISINEAWTEITGYTKEEISTISAWTKKAYCKKRGVIKDVIDKLYKTDKRVDEGEFEIKTKSGDKRIWHFSSAPLGKSADGGRLVISMALDVTERKEREIEYKNLMDGMNDTAFVINFEGKFIEVNDTAVEFLGYSREELLSMGPNDIDANLSPEDIERLIDRMKMGETGVFETTHKTKSGDIIPVEVSSSLITYHGKPSILSVTRDIRERKKTEDAILKSEEQLSAIFNNTSDLQILFSAEEDGEFSVVRVNETAIATAKRLGFDVSKESFLGKTVKEIVKSFLNPNQRSPEETLKIFQQAAETVKPVSFEEAYSFGNRYYSAEVTIVPILDGGGKCTYLLWTSHDVTGRKKAEDALRVSEDQLSVIFNNAFDSLILLTVDKDSEFRIEKVNKSVVDVVRYLGLDLSQESFIGKTLREAMLDLVGLQEQVFNNAFNCIQKTIKTGKPGFYEETYNFENESFSQEITTVPVLDQKGNCLYILLTLHDITKTKKTMGALQKSEERFQTVIENLPDEIFVHGLDGKFILVNKASCEKTGYTKDELLGMNVSNIDHESISRDDRKNIWLKLQKKGGFDRIESTHYRKDGSSYPAEIYFGTVTFKGSPMIIGIAHDITERKKAIEKLKESEERFQTIIENLPHAVSLHDLDGNFVLVNEALCKHTGYTRDEYMKMKVENVDRLSQTRDDRKKIWLKLNKGGHTHFKSKLSCKDGSCYPVEIYINAISLEGKPMILAIAQDISDRKKARESLQKSEEKYRNLYDSMIEAFSRSDMEGNIIEFNKQYLDMLGYNGDEIKKLKYTDLTPEKWHEMEAKIVKEQIIKRGYSDVYEKEYIKKDGTVFPVELRVFLLKDDDGSPNGMWTIVRDITERKKSEEELRKIERLESLGILAGGIAHDFNNLLTGILGNLSLAQMAEGEDFLNILEEAKQASIQAKNLTQQLLTFSKGGEPIKGKVSIEDIIRESAEFSLHGSNVRCEFDFENNLWKVEVDKGQMSQVIDNLVINSNQAMPEGGKIHIKAENTILEKENLLYLPEGKYVKITLQDEGIGVPEEYLSRIFDPYFSTKQEGSGLGLATVYSIVQRHEGYITVQSKVGNGTTFFIYLPAIEEKIAKSGEKKAIRRTLKGEGRILIMDDEKIVRRAVGGMLSRLGYTVESAENGEETISKYKEAMNSGKLFDGVILDLTVPGGMGGKKTIEKLLKIDPDVKAIVSSGYSTDPVMANYEKYGFKAVVAKPFDLKELNEAIEKVLG